MINEIVNNTIEIESNEEEDNFFESFGALSFVQGSFKAGPNCFNICFIPNFPPAK